ncbi:MAG: GldG family protein [Gammaproteobacteria bacterium]
MRMGARRSLLLSVQGAVFTVLLTVAVGLAAWLSERHAWDWDWTENQRNTLSRTSQDVLGRMPGTVRITVYVAEDDGARQQVRDLVARYRRAKEDITLEFRDPARYPEEVRSLGVSANGEWLIRYRDRLENVPVATESTVTNALQRLLRGGTRTVYFLTGHGERNPGGQANHDFLEFSGHLARRGIKLEPLNLLERNALPPDIGALVVADPRSALLPPEVALLKGYAESGGALMLLLEEDSRVAAEELFPGLDVSALPGVVVDATTRDYQIDDPAFAMVTGYDTQHGATRGMSMVTVFPRAVALDVGTRSISRGWIVDPLLLTLERSWTETGPIEGTIDFDPLQGERKGPLVIGVAATRMAETPDGRPRSQRVLVVGDADFLANTWLGNGGNLELGLNLFNWLVRDDSLLSIPPKAAPDHSVVVTADDRLVLGLGIQLLLPLALILIGVFTAWRRRRL